MVRDDWCWFNGTHLKFPNVAAVEQAPQFIVVTN